MKTNWKQITTGTFLALLLVVGNVQAKGTEAEISINIDAIETTLELENWMTDLNTWNENSFVWMVQDREESIEIESWMTNEFTWNSDLKVKEPFKTEAETKLELESWMTENNIWSR